MTTLETFPHQKLSEVKSMLAFRLSLVSQSLVSGRLIGTKDTTCQPDTIYLL
jgi:hypothetical protein